jgi:hypothetical protein
MIIKVKIIVFDKFFSVIKFNAPLLFNLFFYYSDNLSFFLILNFLLISK